MFQITDSWLNIMEVCVSQHRIRMITAALRSKDLGQAEMTDALFAYVPCDTDLEALDDEHQRWTRGIL